MKAVGLAYRGSIIIKVHMKENHKDAILDQMCKIINRIKRKYQNPNILVYGDFNTGINWIIKHIENYAKLK